MVQDITNSDRVCLREIEKRSTLPMVLYFNGSVETRYFLSAWQKLFVRYTRYSRWIKAFVSQGKTIGFLGVEFQLHQRKGSLLQQVLPDEDLQYLPAMIQKAGAWLEESGKASMIVEIAEERSRVSEYLLEHGWNRQYTWVELIKWLDERAKQPIE